MSAIEIYLIFSMLAIMWLDITSFTIPNWLVGSLLVLYPVSIKMAHFGIDWKMALAGAGAVLVVGYIIFARRIMGGGDIKLLVACALWVGLQNLIDFLIVVSLLGGLFAVFLLVARKLMPFLQKKENPAPLPRIFRDGAPVPYGVAIAIGFLILMWSGKVPVFAG